MVIGYKGIFKWHKKLLKFDQYSNLDNPQECSVDSNMTKTVYSCIQKISDS